MSADLIPANPADLMVIRNVTPNITTFSVPFSRFGKIKIGGRGTLVKLTSGTLAVFSPVALTEQTKTRITELGSNVGYIVALDYEHHIFISEWAKEYPNAKIIGPEGLPEKRAKQKDPKINNDKFAVVFKKDSKRDVRISEEFDADFDYEYIDGHANKEIVFNYKPEQVLIEADLMFNLPAIEQYSKVPEHQRPRGFLDKLFRGVQNTAGDATWAKRFNWYLAKDRKIHGVERTMVLLKEFIDRGVFEVRRYYHPCKCVMTDIHEVNGGVRMVSLATDVAVDAGKPALLQVSGRTIIALMPEVSITVPHVPVLQQYPKHQLP
ncbi:nuclear qri2 nse4 [Trichoderma arundinaceum]|uniref:Nuclear qri2 nse4 n=1 Tax=Trichoderma arundinaceum TaxID=490622 RepID=A0A395NQK1_TRIAR|nr:nuclear qri2 nse4 [Trichoderma arundinaceum]